ncbi:MAG: helix-turn-helix domain-containing protein, partial [Sediminibacterium sp.]
MNCQILANANQNSKIKNQKSKLWFWGLSRFFCPKREKNKFGKTKKISILQLNQLAMSNAGKNLRYLRKLRGWTQEEFANKLNI